MDQPGKMHWSRQNILQPQQMLHAMIITKLDGTAKGGVVLGNCNQFNIPVKYIGVGEKMTDLIVFDNMNLLIPCLIWRKELECNLSEVKGCT